MKTLVLLPAEAPVSDLALRHVAGAPLLERMIQRVLSATEDFFLTVVTTTQPEDDPVEELCGRIDVKCFRGNSIDPLDRHYQAAGVYGAERVVRIPVTSPLIDPALIDQALRRASERRDLLEYLSNLHPPSYPAGNDIEVVSMETLKIAWKEALDPSEREGITRFIWTRPERFRLENLTWEGGLDLSASRGWSLRNEQDYLTIRAIFDELWTVRRPVFTLNDILSLISRHPEIVARDPGEIARRRRDSPGKPTPGRA